jgi:hypothetical protein
VRWFPVPEARLYRSAKVSYETLKMLSEASASNDNDPNDRVLQKKGHSDSDATVHVLTVGFVALLGIAIGRLSHQQ